MTTEQWSQIIQQGESSTVEFKQSFNKAVIETLVAFANAKGGQVLVGVKDNGEIIGIDVSKESLQKWLNEIKQKTFPQLLPELELISLEDKQVVVFVTSEYPLKPVETQGRYFKRMSNSNHQMNISEIADLHLMALNSSWDLHIDREHGLEHLSTDKIAKAVQMVRHNGVTIAEQQTDFLRKTNLIKQDKPSFAAYLLFKENDCLLSTVELGFFQDEITIKDSDRSQTDLISQVDDLMNYVIKHINKAVIITGKPQNEQRWQYPLEAIREIVLNMIVHRDYQSSADSVIKIFSNKIEFFNPGLLPVGITIDDLLTNNYSSNPRNKAIADFFKSLGLIEKYGSGIGRILRYFADAGLPSPEFKVSSGGFVVTVFADNKAPKDVTDNVTDNVTDRRRSELVAFIKADASVSVDALAEKLMVNRRTVLRDIEQLKNDKIIKRVGSAKAGCWELIE